MERKRINSNSRRRPSGAAVLRPGLTATLCRTLFEEWALSGYAGISLERVASRTGAGKVAIHRRWPPKLGFASAAPAASRAMAHETVARSVAGARRAARPGSRRARAR